MTRTRTIHFIVLLLFVCPVRGQSGNGPRHWRTIGPGGGGALFLPTVSPTDPNRVLVACDMTGAYISDDAGRSWRTFNLRGRVRFFAFDPHDANVIYAATIGLWRSVDAGRTWRLISPNPKSVTGVAMANDHAGESLLTNGQSSGQITALAIDPSNSQDLYAAYRLNNATQIRFSSDGGTTWQEVASSPGAVHSISIDPRSRDIYAAGENFILARRNGSWQNFPLSQELIAFSPSFSNSVSPVFYAATNASILVSQDVVHWTPLSLPGSSAKIRTIAASPADPNVLYASYSDLEEGLPGFKKKFLGVMRTADRGRSWQLVWKESDQAAANLHDAWVSPLFGPGWAENPIGLAVAATNSNLVYSTDYGRVLRSIDGGKSWEAIYSTHNPAGNFTGRGLEATTSYGVHFDPFDAKRIFVSYTDIGLFRSEDAGTTWTSGSAGVPEAWRNTTYWMVFDPDVRGRAWSAMSKVHDLPRPKMWQRKQPSTYEGGICASTDGGKTWQLSSAGLPSSAVTHILLDPTSPPRARTLYATAFGRGVYKSTDDGKTWSLKNNGIEGPEPFAWRLARDGAGTLYVVIARRSDDGSIGNTGDGAVYKSTDGAEHWTRLSLPNGVNGPNGLAIDANNSKHLLLAAWGRSTPPIAQGGGIFVSLDGGKSWRNTLSKDKHIYDITEDSRDPKVFYAAGFESSTYRSADGGNTWQRIAGFNFKWGHRVIPDPADPAMIYITTYGGGVWHGPAKGDPSAIDEIATPAVMHGK